MHVEECINVCRAPDLAPACARRSSSGSESEDERERPRKPVPKWARGAALAGALAAQAAVDPDEIFQLHAKTCPLSEVFTEPGALGAASDACAFLMKFTSIQRCTPRPARSARSSWSRARAQPCQCCSTNLHACRILHATYSWVTSPVRPAACMLLPLWGEEHGKRSAPSVSIPLWPQLVAWHGGEGGCVR